MNEIDVDYCIVGAGYAGLTAALRLQQLQNSVAVLEARDRVGGRIWSETLSDGTPIDLGGAWVSTSQPGIWGLAKEMGIATYRQPTRGENLYIDPSGKPGRWKDLAPVGVIGLLELGLTIWRLNRMAATIVVDAPWKSRRALEWDSQSVGTWLNRNMIFSRTGRGTLRKTLTNMFALDVSAVSLLHLLFHIRTVGKFQRLFGTKVGDAEESRVRGGAQAIAKAMATVLGPAVHLNAPVRHITQNASGVIVSSDSLSVKARRAIIAIPTALTAAIRFDPPLSNDRAQLIQRFPGGSLIKFLLVYDEPFWRSDGLNGESLDPKSPVPVSYDCGLPDEEKGPGLINFFAGDSDARRLATLTPEARKQIVVDATTKRFGPRGAELSNTITPNFVECIWSGEDWTRGSFNGVVGPGVYIAQGFGPALREPVGRLHWAGVDTSTRWFGCMDGAVQSGERAAAEVLAAEKALASGKMLPEPVA